jgi:hypothetical protein
VKRLLTSAIAALAAVAIAACGGGGSEGGPAASPPSPTSGSPSPTSPPPQEKNVFQNPGLEEGRDGWTSISPPDFILSDDAAHSGQTSALLEMRARPQDEGTKVFYLVQEVAPQEFPELIAGNYRVTKWLRGTPLQYLQFAVIAFGANNLPGGFANHQIRYILAGIDKEPFDIANAHFVFLSREDPPLNEWVSFQANVRDDFVKLWGDVPEYEKIRVLFEARYDDKVAGDGAVEADVYYDDLYFGPAQ